MLVYITEYSINLVSFLIKLLNRHLSFKCYFSIKTNFSWLHKVVNMLRWHCNKQILILKEKAIPRIKFSIRSICFWKTFIHGGIFWGNRLHDFAPEKKCWLAWTEIVIESSAFLFRSRKLLISLFCNNLNGCQTKLAFVSWSADKFRAFLFGF